jgi:hypothetical protein
MHAAGSQKRGKIQGFSRHPTFNKFLVGVAVGTEVVAKKVEATGIEK